MRNGERVVTAKLPGELISRLDEIAHRIDRSKSWIIRQALAEWFAEEQRRYELTLEALKDFDEGIAELAEWVARQTASDRVDEARAELEAKGLVA